MELRPIAFGSVGGGGGGGGGDRGRGVDGGGEYEMVGALEEGGGDRGGRGEWEGEERG